MYDIEFPQPIIDVERKTCYCFEHADGHTFCSELLDAGRLLKGNIPTDTPIALILSDDTVYCGTFEALADDNGIVIAKARSLVSQSCVISIPVNQITGWCILPNDEC